jgi:class 3 adenylate cyclase/tetratricopeptide (TPR) repeat protein
MPGHTCFHCGVRNRARAKFCDACGRELRPSAAKAAQLLAEDELKYVTVLFADIVNSTAMVADVAPDEAQFLLTPAVKIMLEAVREFGGTINRVVGDGVLAFFGFPHSQEDHALRACCAAQRMHEEAANLAVPAALRIGLASGFALLSADDETALGSHVAFGVTVHLAARLQSMARPGAILCSAETKTLAGPAAEMVPLGRQPIRGLPIEQEVFEVTRVRQSSPRFDVTATVGLSPYVGRSYELELLQDCASASRAGGAVTAAIVGDAGAGKSRLVWRFLASLTSQNWRLLRADAISYGRDIPYLLIAALLRSCFGIEESDSATVGTAKVRMRLHEMVGDDGVLATAVLSLLDLPLGEGAVQWDALDPLRRREALRESVCQVVRSLARRTPTAVVIEDLHWSDEESLRVLDDIAQSADALLLVATYRTGFEPAWSRTSPRVVGLAPLSHNEMTQLLGRAFPDLSDSLLQQELIERAAGNPFFLEEMARSARASTMRLDEISGTSQASATIGGSFGDARRPVIPATIEAVLAERIDRLDPDDKRVLRAASALGNRFSQAVLQNMFDDRRPAVFQDQLSRLRAAGLLRRDRFADGEDGFAHALIQEVSYNALPRERRRDLHARIVQTIAAIHADSLTEQAETLTFHAFRGEVWEAVIVHARRAGQRAARRSAYREAAVFFEQAITAHKHLPATPEALAEQIDLRFELRNSLFPTSNIGKSLGFSQQAEWLALNLGDRQRLGWATAFHARDLTLLGRPSEGLHVAHRALDVAGTDEDLVATIESYIALAAYYQGDYTQSAMTFRTLVETVERRDRMRRLGLPGPAVVFFRGWFAWALARLGQAEEADAVTDEQCQLAEESAQPLAVTFAHLSRGFAFAHAERFEAARQELQIAIDLCRRWEFFAWFTNIASCLGHVLSRLGDYEAGIDLLTQAIDRTKTSGILVSHAHELAWLAEAFDGKGDHARAARQAEEAINVALSHEERGNEALARVVLAEALMKGGQIQESLTQFRSSLAAAAECQMAPLILRCRAGLATLEAACSLA